MAQATAKVMAERMAKATAEVMVEGTAKALAEETSVVKCSSAALS